MMRLGWIAVVGVSVLLGGCERTLHETFPPCPFPGAVMRTTCYFHLDVQRIDEQSHVIGTIHKGVVQANRTRGVRQMLPDYAMADYPFYEYAFHVHEQDLATLKQLLQDSTKREKDAVFVSEPGTAFLKITSPPSSTGR